MSLLHRSSCLVSLLLLYNQCIAADTSEVNQFPDALTTNHGRRVTSGEEWRAVRRPELLKLAEEQMYGCAPKPPKRMRFEVQEQASNALGGKATRNCRIGMTISVGSVPGLGH
ncbi:MAG TPA: hypothetical protein VE860_08095 [Chthoniobacterales bacterium]|jgi:hypothetical protein|nr:hypothetical protein [Chthoniobacterales bacterium]